MMETDDIRERRRNRFLQKLEKKQANQSSSFLKNESAPLHKEKIPNELNSQIISESTNLHTSSQIKTEDPKTLINSFLAQNSDRKDSDFQKYQTPEFNRNETILKENIGSNPEPNIDYKEFYKNHKRFERNTV